MKQLNTVDQLKFDFYTADAIVSNLLTMVVTCISLVLVLLGIQRNPAYNVDVRPIFHTGMDN